MSFTKLALFILTINFLNAHTFWLLPSSFEPQANDLVSVKIFIGHVLEPEEYTRNPFHIKKFFVYGKNFEQRLPGIDGKSPAGYLRLSKEGVYEIAYESYASAAFLPLENFKKYLEEEDLMVEKLPQKESIQEYYRRFAKSILFCGKEIGNPEPFIAGMPFEIVFLGNTHENAKYSFQILYEGEYLTSQVVKATFIESGLSEKQTSNESGEVTFSLHEGSWLISTVMIKECTDEENIDFESYWASLTFTIKNLEQHEN